MRARLSSSLGADKALRLVICQTEIKVRVGVITDWQLDFFGKILFFPFDLCAVDTCL